MRMILKEARRFADNELGSSAIEYGLLATLIGVAAIVAFTVAGNGLMSLFGANAGDTGAGGAIRHATNSL